MNINYIKASGVDINDLVERIEDELEGEPNTHVAIACMVVAILSQKPDVTPEQLQDTIKMVSELLVAQLFDASDTGAIN